MRDAVVQVHFTRYAADIHTLSLATGRSGRPGVAAGNRLSLRGEALRVDGEIIACDRELPASATGAKDPLSIGLKSSRFPTSVPSFSTDTHEKVAAVDFEAQVMNTTAQAVTRVTFNTKMSTFVDNKVDLGGINSTFRFSSLAKLPIYRLCTVISTTDTRYSTTPDMGISMSGIGQAATSTSQSVAPECLFNRKNRPIQLCSRGCFYLPLLLLIEGAKKIVKQSVLQESLLEVMTKKFSRLVLRVQLSWTMVATIIFRNLFNLSSYCVSTSMLSRRAFDSTLQTQKIHSKLLRLSITDQMKKVK
ncbi:hypothetical protein BDQ17DRAFT_1333218 [Cyathus striatus]|nr:hypothetical protein BDQ17DRAFT_1333218 [Cyathus striatus]